MNEQMFNSLVFQTPFKRDLYFLECSLYRIVLKYIKKEDYTELIEFSRELLKNMIYCYSFKTLEDHFKTIRCSYSKFLFEKCSIDMNYFVSNLKRLEGKL